MKLYSKSNITHSLGLEENTIEKDNELLIDKVLKYSKKETSPMSLTADLFKQRVELKKDIEDKLGDKSQDDSGDSSSDSDDSVTSSDDDESKDNEPSDADSDSDSDDDKDDESKEKDDDSDDDESKDKDDESDDSKDSDDDDSESKDDKSDDNDDDKSKDSDNEDDDTSAASDVDDLKSIIGSGHKKEDKKSTATESRKLPKLLKPKPILSNIFNSLKDKHNKYLVSLEAYNLTSKKIALEEQPIVYVKEEVIDSINNIIKIADSYVHNNNTFIETKSKAIKSLNEKVTIFAQFVESEKYEFTDTLVSDKDILSNIAVVDNSNIRDTLKILVAYLDSTESGIRLLSNNPFTEIKSSYANSNFIAQDNDLMYKTMLPGFSLIKAHIPEYRNYLKTNIQDYQFYKLKTFKTEHLYSLSAISITDDKDIIYITENLNKLLLNASTILDSLGHTTVFFTKFIDTLKVLIFDIEKNKHKNLAELEIDSKLKDFIKFKLIIEMCYVNANIILDYLTTTMSVVNLCVKLKD